jgi:hypothetical protein
MESSWIVEVIHGARFYFQVSKNVLAEKEHTYTCRVKKGQMVKTSEDHNFILENQNWENK